jgi:DNA-binding MarR family transcriptional regulator
MTEDKRTLIEHGILDLIDQQDGRVTQTELSNSLRVSIGLVNAYLKKLIQKGYVKVSNVKASTVRYMLTSEGFTEKYRLTRRYMANSLNYYIKIKQAVEQRIVRLKLDEVRTVVFVGSSEIAEIMHLYLGDTKIKIVGVFDIEKNGKDFFFEHPIKEIHELPDYLNNNQVDKILLNYFEEIEDVENKLLDLGVNRQAIEARW